MTAVVTSVVAIPVVAARLTAVMITLVAAMMATGQLLAKTHALYPIET